MENKKNFGLKKQVSSDEAPEVGGKRLEDPRLCRGGEVADQELGQPPLDNPDEVLSMVVSGEAGYEDKLVDHGIPALMKLINVAQGHSGQSHHLRRLLLGVYNGYEWPFELQRLRALDRDLQFDSLLVVALATFSPYEVHTLVKDGGLMMKEFWLRESEQDD
ncbi:DUF7673 family protein [Halomonas alimentaria]|uniref:DUF7673 family protein n=1 Tax=Halomonas alimentaria TaxID=147248 RepID=UPI00249398C8|nr:hypothetical protein [Halomonas alimentaria]